ncbi:MAG: glycoside hydrolase family 31 protein [Eubacteriales bacterium]|nr:glycoside hydrolase family 31 protein [Eubacteriales bacterium]
MTRLHHQQNKKIRNLRERIKDDRRVLSYDCDATVAYGTGERFDGVDRMGKTTETTIIEKFTHQGENTYFPLPFFFCNDGHGVFVQSDAAAVFTLSAGHVEITLPEEECDVFFLYGTPREIVAQFVEMTGKPILPPDWAFGPWVSANRWKSQKDVEEQLDKIESSGYPATSLVIEAWSDEATFYLWNGAEYDGKSGGEPFSASDLRFREPWPNPQAMIERMHRMGIKLVLWQIPALKQLEKGEVCPQHDRDDAYALEQGFVVENADGTPYRIPRQWFIGAHVPDFTVPELCSWWMEKRRYLLEMGVDGFKTDGGEFMHDLSVRFHNGQSGVMMRNRYVADYETAYTRAIGKDRTLFSRAGYLGAQTTPIHWAGDQVSSFEEMRSVLNAGLSLGLSGVPFWSFDIGGFAGPLPSAELYLRSTAMAAFVPVMQWHSEPLGGQFGGFDTGLVNDRSPWNIALHASDERVERVARFYARLRMNLLPELLCQAKIATQSRLPMMRHLVLDYPNDAKAQVCHDEFMLGDLLIAPVLHEGATGRDVYLPQGQWYSFLTCETLSGGQTLFVEADRDEIPVFLRTPGAVALNLPESLLLGGDVGNSVEKLNTAVLAISGKANVDYADAFGNRAVLRDGEILQANLRVLDVSTLQFAEI